MSATPEAVGQEPEKPEDKGATPTPETPEQQPQGVEDELRKLKEENQQLRASRREETAKRLATEHKLPEAVAELLKTIPENEMEERAKAIAEQMPKVEGQPSPTTTEEEPENKDKLEKVGAANDQGAAATPVPGRNEKSEEAQKIEGMGSWKEIEDHFNQKIAKQREQNS